MGQLERFPQGVAPKITTCVYQILIRDDFLLNFLLGSELLDALKQRRKFLLFIHISKVLAPLFFMLVDSILEIGQAKLLCFLVTYQALFIDVFMEVIQLCGESHPGLPFSLGPSLHVTRVLLFF